MEKAWPPTPVLLPGESHAQRRPMYYSPWGCQELDTTEYACTHTHTHTHTHTRYICTLYVNIYMTEVTEHTPVTLTCFIIYIFRELAVSLF